MYGYRTLGIFRLLLVTLVVSDHLAANLAPPAFLRAVEGYEIGRVAILASFCLSGLVVAEAADRAYQARPLAFLANRLLRIVPPFLAAVALSILLHRWLLSAGAVQATRNAAVMTETAFGLPNILGNLAGFLPLADRLVSHDFLTIAWAVRVAVAFYLVVLACLCLGRLHPRARAVGFGPVIAAAYVLLLPAFALAVLGRLPATLAFVPYFGFGAALRFALRGASAGCWLAAASVPLMLWQFLAQPDHHPTGGFERAVDAQLILLGGLLAAMTALAATTLRAPPLSRARRADRLLGDLTYPLYLYHTSALVLVAATFPPADTYNALAWAAVLATLVSVAFHALIDPPLAVLRDRVRGGEAHGGAAGVGPLEGRSTTV